MSQNQEVSDSYRFFIDNSVSMSNKFQGGGGGGNPLKFINLNFPFFLKKKQNTTPNKKAS